MIAARMLKTRSVKLYRYDAAAKRDYVQNVTLHRGRVVHFEEVVPAEDIVVFANQKGGGACFLKPDCYKLLNATAVFQNAQPVG